MHSEPQEALMDDSSSRAGQAVAPGSAAIASLVAAPSGLAVAATGSYAEGIGRVDFVLVDLTGDPLESVVDRKDVDYAKPPKHVAEAWDSSVALAAELPYRVFFHVYDRTGVNLVAYDRRDFTCESVQRSLDRYS
jgi:hypothetical protein